MNISLKFKKKDKTNLWAGICLMGAFCFMLFLYAPLELFFYNQQDFWFDVYTLLPLLLVLFAVSFLLSTAVMAIFFFVCEKLYYIVLPLVSIAFLSTYIQGNFLVSYLPPMDGSKINWDEYSDGKNQTIILWVAVTVIICVAYALARRKKFVKAVQVVSVCMTLMLTVTLASIMISTKGYEKKLDTCITTKDEYTFSTDKNFIILLLDSVDSATFSKIMEENPEYNEIFEDFTYYANTLGKYPCTSTAVPHILSGKTFLNTQDFNEYNLSVYQDGEFFASLEQKGYKLGMYSAETPCLNESIFRFDNILNQKSKVNSYLEYAEQVIKLVGFRYAPHELKKVCTVWPDAFAKLRESQDEYPSFTMSNREFYDRISTSEVSMTEQNCFKFLHIQGAHAPFFFDKDVNYVYDADYDSCTEACLTIAKAYLEKLKESDVYDNSVIIVMADHGLDGSDTGIYTGRQNPILFVKGVNESHDMVISQAPISYDDLQEAFARLLDGKDSSEIFDYKEGDYRERTYLYYNMDRAEYMYEYVTVDHASKDESLIATGKEYIKEQ